MIINALAEFEGYGVFAYFAKGIHDADSFADELKRQWDEEVNAADVRCSYARFCPAGQDCDTMTLLYPQKQGHGAFPITYVELN